MNSRNILFATIGAVLIFLCLGFGRTSSSLQVLEDFSTIAQADITNSSGLWNIQDHRAQAAVVSGALNTRALSFGDGSDGSVSSTNGYTFDTNAHPNGYNFTSLSITGGTITVTGSNPLTIRSLQGITITPSILLDGDAGGDGYPTTSATATGRSGGSAHACKGNGGQGGNVAATALAMNGGAGLDNNGAPDGATPGNGSIAAGAPGLFGTVAAGSPGANFDTVGFVCPGGGGGGGGHGAPGDPIKATGGAGGAGGGLVHLVSVGDLRVGAFSAKGGNGGKSANSSSRCSGNGSGGSGGAIWLQSYHALTSTSEPTTTAGTSGVSNGSCLLPPAGIDGYSRADNASGNPSAWNSGTSTFFDTSLAAPLQVYTVQSKSYDLGTVNAGFNSPAIVIQTLNGGSITVNYAGSTDNVNFSGFTSNLSTLANQNYRYLKFQVSISTPASAAVTPYVSKIVIPYDELNSPNRSNIGLAAGCASLDRIDKNGSRLALEEMLLGILFVLLAHSLASRTRKSTRQKAIACGV